MSSAQYLYRRPSGVYFVRLCVPGRLKAAVGKGEVHQTTGCRDFRLAKIVAAEMAAHWHKAIESLARMDVSKVRAGSIELLGNGFIALTDAATALGADPPQLAQRLADLGAHFYVVAKNWTGWAVANIHEDLEHEEDDLGQVRVVISGQTLGGPAAQLRFSGRLRIRYTEEAIEAAQVADTGICQFLVWPSRDRGFIVDFPGRPIGADLIEISKIDVENLRASLAHQLGPAAVPPEPPTSQQKPKTLFSELTREYLARNSMAWKPDQLERRTDQCDAFKDLIGDLPLENITRIILRKFSDEIARLPTQRQRVKRRYDCPGATYRDLIALADVHVLPRLTADSQQRMLDGISEVFTWAERETYISANPAKGLGAEVWRRSGTVKKKQHEQREAFSPEDFKAIFSASWFMTGAGTRTAKGIFYAYRPHYYWLPLLALHTGGRLNELSQLYLRDIVEKEGPLCVDFNLIGEDKLDLDDADAVPSGDKSLKTINSRRVVPLHHRLMALGLMDYVTALKAAGYQRLFPELAFDARKGYGKAAGKWFNERYLGNELGIPRNGQKTFHSFRHNFATALGSLGVETTTKSDLMGHARGDVLVDARYDKGAVIERHETAINRIAYPLPAIAAFSVDAALAAVADALKLKERHAGHRSK